MAANRQRGSARVLMVTASIGEGHNSAASALTSALERVEPACTVHTVDLFESMGEGSETLVRQLYQLAVQHTPFLQELWYRAVGQFGVAHWFYRSVIGERMARSLRGEVRDVAPDVIVSTYPLATAGLSRLRRNGELDMPVVATMSDYAPHAFWIYPDVDRYFVLSEHSLAAMRELAPDASVSVCAPLVAPEFRQTGARVSGRARERHGIPADALAVLVSCGAMGLGSVTSAVDAVLAADPSCHAVVVCGHNERLRDELWRAHGAHERLTALGWVDDMAELTAAVDAVINNAGGLTAAEALASGKALVMYRPIAGHGRACADAMADAGLAVVARRRPALTRLLRSWVAEPVHLHTAQLRAMRHARGHRLTDTAREILDLAGPRPDADRAVS